MSVAILQRPMSITRQEQRSQFLMLDELYYTFDQLRSSTFGQVRGSTFDQLRGGLALNFSNLQIETAPNRTIIRKLCPEKQQVSRVLDFRDGSIILRSRDPTKITVGVREFRPVSFTV